MISWYANRIVPLAENKEVEEIFFTEMKIVKAAEEILHKNKILLIKSQNTCKYPTRCTPYGRDGRLLLSKK